MQRLLTTYQVADMLGTTHAGVIDWIGKGLLKAKKLPVAFPITVINQDTVIQGFKKDDIVEALGL